MELRWAVRAAAPLEGKARLTIRLGGQPLAASSIDMRFAQPMPVVEADYVPEPRAAQSNYLVGAFLCPLWKHGTLGSNWGRIAPYPEREPVLGWYDEGDPEVTDWEILWSLEHGITFFVPCWYRKRGNLGQPVEPVLEHWLHEGLFHARYGDQFQFAILWENGNPIACGVASEADLLDNLLPYWINQYFQRPNYLRVDGKPLLFIYRPEILVRDLGGEEAARQALDKVRDACRSAGLNGLILLGEHHGDPSNPLQQMADIGLDYAYSYHWPTFTPLMPAAGSPDAIAAAQALCWGAQARSAAVPSIVTVSMGWDARPWNGKGPQWHLPPGVFRETCRKAKDFVDDLPGGKLDSRMVLIDNWNEFGEGHYIFPHRRYGFGYLDAIREVFASVPGPCVNLVPEDLGLGPYDHGYRSNPQPIPRAR